MKRYLWLGCLILSSCAVTASEGMLASVTSSKTLDTAYLERQCDVEDGAACYFLRGRLPALPRLPIVQGIAPEDRAVFVVQVGPLAEPRYFLRQKEDQSVRALPVAKAYTKESSAWRLERVEVSQLEENKTYELLVADKAGRLVDVRSFKPMRDKPGAFRFAFISGGDGRSSSSAEESALWKSLLDREPRLLLGLGNLVATEGEEPLDPAALWERYAETRATLNIFRLPTLVPFAATWNERDFGAPDKRAGRDNPHVDGARGIQEAFFPSISDTQAIAEGPGIAKALRAANQTFILMDARSFREGDAVPPACRAKPGPACPAAQEGEAGNSTHFGRLQENWALGIAEGAKGPVWFLSGDPWFGGAYPMGSLEGSHPASFRAFREGLEESVRKAAKAGGHYPFFFGSGNPLLTEAKPIRPFLKNAYGSWEFSTGPVQGGAPEADLPAPERGAHRAAAARYLFFTTWPKGDGLSLSAEAVEPGNRAGFSLRYEAKPLVSPAKKKARAKGRR